MADFTQIIEEINTNLPDNTTQSITAEKLRDTLIDLTETIEEQQDDFETTIESNIESYVTENAKFATNQLVSETSIDNTQLENPVAGSLAKAEDAMQLKYKLNDIDFFVQNGNPEYVANKSVSPSAQAIISRANSGIMVVEIPSGFEKIKFLGVSFQWSRNIGYGFGNIIDGVLTLDPNNIHSYSIDSTISDWWAEQEYEIPIPNNCTHFVATVYFQLSGNSDLYIKDDFFAYLEKGQSVKGYIDDEVDEKISESLANIEFTGTTFQSLKERLLLGGNINIAEGEYVFTESVSLQSNTKIVGVPGKTIFKSSINAPLFDIYNKENIYIEGITFEGSFISDEALYYPTIQEIEGNSGTPLTYGFIDFEATITNAYYSRDENTGKITQTPLNGWRGMGNITYQGESFLINQHFNSSQLVILFCDSDNTVLGRKYSGNGERDYVYINSDSVPEGTEKIYWNVSSNETGTPRLYMKYIDGVITECNEIGIYIHSDALSDGYYPKKIVLFNCLFKNFNYAGILTKNIINNYSSSKYQNAPKFISCRFENNVNGAVLEQRSEFMTFSVCEFSYNQLGLWVKCSNTNISSSKFIRNLCLGLVSNGTGANSNHYSITDCEFVHNGLNATNTNDGTFDIVFTNSVGPLVVNSSIFAVEGIVFNKATGVFLNGCGIMCPIYITENATVGKNSISNSMFDERNSSIIGDTTRLSLKNNYCVHSDNNDSNFNN